MELHAAGILPRPEAIAGNALALLVRPELATSLKSIPDLMRPGVHLLIPPQESDPLGKCIVELVDKDGLTDAVAEKLVRGEISEQLPGLREGLATAGIDSAVIYASMLEAFDDLGTPVLLTPPFDMSDRIVFGTGTIERYGQHNATADAFVACLIGPEGQERLIASGFLPREKALRNLQTSK